MTNRHSRRRFLAAAPVAAALGATPAVAHPDAALMALGVEMTAARKWEADLFARGNLTAEEELQITTVSLRLLTRILEAKASTVDGLIIKARAISWCHADRFAGFAKDSALRHRPEGPVLETPTTDFLVLDSLIFDLFEMAGEPIVEWELPA